MSQSRLTCLRNADGETVGYFSDYVAEMAARQEWTLWYEQQDDIRRVRCPEMCHSKKIAVIAAELENVEPGDGDRVDYVQENFDTNEPWLTYRLRSWYARGAASVEVQRFLINKYRRPGMSARDSDLGGPVDAAGVLYVLKIKAPR